MRLINVFVVMGMIVSSSATAADDPKQKVIFAIHGGARVIARDKLTKEVESDVRTGLDQALNEGYSTLKRGGSSLDAVEAAIRLMEDGRFSMPGAAASWRQDNRAGCIDHVG